MNSILAINFLINQQNLFCIKFFLLHKIILKIKITFFYECFYFDIKN